MKSLSRVNRPIQTQSLCHRPNSIGAKLSECLCHSSKPKWFKLIRTNEKCFNTKNQTFSFKIITQTWWIFLVESKLESESNPHDSLCDSFQPFLIMFKHTLSKQLRFQPKFKLLSDWNWSNELFVSFTGLVQSRKKQFHQNRLPFLGIYQCGVFELFLYTFMYYFHRAFQHWSVDTHVFIEY